MNGPDALRAFPVNISDLKELPILRDTEHYHNGTYIKTVGNYVRFIKIFTKVAIIDVQVNMSETRIEYYVGCFSLRNLTNPDKYVKASRISNLEICRTYCEDVELYGINSDRNCICITDIIGLINEKPGNCRKICDDTFGFCGGKNLFSVYSKGSRFGYISTSHPFGCIMQRSGCLTCQPGYHGYGCVIPDCSDSKICGELKKCERPKLHNSTDLKIGICTCTEGYSIDNNFNCQDIDECQSVAVCANTFICNNTLGSYLCTCRWGYENESGNCRDIDECKYSTSCGITYICNNTIGSYLCTCRWGFEDRSGFCGDIDECYGGLLCDLESTNCVNQPGSYSCYCKYGFERFTSGLPAQCYDIDECLRNEHDCVTNSSYCFNKPGLFTCECHRGYKRRNRFSCEDINECTEFSHGCGKDSECIHSLGSYECKCPAGSTANVFNYAVECQDTNECEEPNTCNITISVCLNMPFTYICQCFLGYINVDNFTCRFAPTTKPNDEFDKSLTTTGEEYWFTATTTPSIFEESLDFFQDFGSLIIIVAFIATVLVCLIITLMRRTPSRSGTVSTLTTVD